MNTRSMIISLLGAACLIAHAAPSSAFTPKQEARIQALIQQQIMKKPQTIIQSLTAYQKQQTAQRASTTQTTAKQVKNQLLFNPKDPNIGSPTASVSIVEFIDYRCGHCRHMGKTLKQAMSQDPSLRLVVKELPIFQGQSTLAAKAAIAASHQRKFQPMHQALLSSQQPLTQANITKIAQSVGLNMAQFKQDLKSPALSKQISQNFALAKKLHINGTPAFVIASTYGKSMKVVSGAIPLEQLKSIIQQTRQAK